MSERKVLNKYYPPDFDPSKIPRMKLSRNRQYTVRLMAPFNMRCNTCGEYIYKGKKFNARKEDVENQDYLGIRIYRFYIKCTRCLQEISFKTDPKNTDYEIEAGATRNFMALKLAEEQAKREEDELKEEEANNPMKLLENRTQQSRNEIELLESLEELRDLNRRQATVDYDTMLQQYNTGETQEQRRQREEREDEEFIKSVKFANGSLTSQQKRIISEEIIEEVKDEETSVKRIKKTENDAVEESDTRRKPTTETEQSSIIQGSTSSKIVSQPFLITKPFKDSTWNKSVGLMSRKGGLSGLVKVKSKTDDSVADKNASAGTTTVVSNSLESKTQSIPKADNSTEKTAVTTSGAVSGGLSLLSGYSDSDSNNDSE